jgi:NADPH2:quinone reductase
MTDVRAVVVDHDSPERLVIRPVPLAPAYRDEVTVRVNAISLNRGEVNRAVRVAEPGWRPACCRQAHGRNVSVCRPTRSPRCRTR